MPRKYELRRRAERQEETRQRIVEATVALHETLGAARTTISDIAARAGVERATVYRHFPDERALLTACSGHYVARHPRPDPAPWIEIADPETRLRAALAEVYAYHRRTERMTDRAIRDLAGRARLARRARAGVRLLGGHPGRARRGLAGLQGAARPHHRRRRARDRLLDLAVAGARAGPRRGPGDRGDGRHGPRPQRRRLRPAPRAWLVRTASPARPPRPAHPAWRATSDRPASQPASSGTISTIT